VELRSGEIHALVGENGSGKSTLVKLLSGILHPDEGSLVVDGDDLRRIGSPAEARELGIATVLQEVLVVGSLTVLDNLWLGADGAFRTRVPESRKRTEGGAVLAQLLERPPPLDVLMETLDLATRQTCAIARALLQPHRVLILDESTSALDVSVRERLFAVLQDLRSRGVAVVFISHRMDEIEALADRATVLRSGTDVGTLENRSTFARDLLQLMTGEELDVASRTHPRGIPGAVVLQVNDLKLSREAGSFSAAFRAGEIVGLAGLEGHGQERFLRVLAGLDAPAEGEVARMLDGTAQPVVSQHRAAQLGIAYVPRDRRRDGIFEPLSILDNFSLPTLHRDAAAGRILTTRRRRRRFAGYVDRLDIKLAEQDDPITTLSGGNQQKVLMARWLATDPRALLLNDPTRGVDARTKGGIYALLGELASEGVAIVVLSTEIEEQLVVMDRVLVFRENQVFAKLDEGELTREALIAAFFGHGPGAGSAR
jgi:ABC-type sugar transport system ATPase subunit